MPLSGTVVNNKDAAPGGHLPLLLVTFQFTDGTYLRLSTNPLNTSEGGYQYDGNDYLARVLDQDISAIQARSEAGIDRVPAATIRLADADSYLWTNYEQTVGFRGARLSLQMVLMDIDPTDGSYIFSSDSPTKYVGICDTPVVEQDGSLRISSSASRNTAKVYCPPVQVQQRCPWIFPITAEQRLDGATNPSSPHWECGYNPDQAGTDPETGGDCRRGNAGFTACNYTKADCQARGMFDEDGSSRKTGRFGGIQWAPRDREAKSTSYVEGKSVTTFNARNDSIYTDRIPMLYGTQWVDPPVVTNELGDGNSTRMEAVVCLGDIGSSGVQQVVVNGVIVPQNGAGADALHRWNFVGDPLGSHTGSRSGSPTNDASYNDGAGNPQGDPYGSMATLEIVVYRQLAESSSIPSVRVLATGPKIWAYAPISAVSGGVATLASGLPNRDIAGNPPYTVQVFGNSNAALNGFWNLSNWTYGPPGTVTLSGTSASGTGGYIRYQTASKNPAWVLLDVLTWTGWQFSQIDVDSFIAAAAVCAADVDYTDLTGASSTHARFIAELCLHQRRSAAEVIQALLAGFRGALVPNSDTGLLQLFVRQTLADQQPAPIAGSNYNTAVSSKTAAGATASGYVAYRFDESNILRDGADGAPRIRIYSDAGSATPNRVVLQFQDADNSYAQDSISIVDEDGVLRAGGYQAGQENVEQFQCLGISNFDQATRVLRTYLAERLRGNETGDTRGTRYVELECTYRAEHLRVGQIVMLSWQHRSISDQLFRVAAIKPATNYEHATITLAWHEDDWYVDTYGQVASPAWSQPGLGRPDRLPYAWKPYGDQPAASDPLFARTEWNFRATQVYETAADGTAIAELLLAGVLPVNVSGAAAPPLVSLQGTTATTGGSVPGGALYYVALASVDADGKLSTMSRPCAVQVPSGTDTNTITVPSIRWPSSAAGYRVYAGVDPAKMSEQGSGATTPSTITISTLNVATVGPVDLLASQLIARVRRVHHAGVFGAALSAVATNTLTIDGAGWSVNQWAGYDVLVVAKADGTDIPIAAYRVSANTATSLTVSPDPVAASIDPGDVVVMMSKPSVTGLTLSDALWENSLSNSGAGLNPDEEIGRRLRIVAGPGVGETYRVVVNTATAITVDGPWLTTPTSASRYVVEESNWLPSTAEAGPIQNFDPAAEVSLRVPVDNYAGAVLAVEVAVTDGAGKESLEAYSPDRLIYIFGQEFSGRRAVVTVASDTDLAAINQLVRADATAAAVEVTLPDVADMIGKAVTVAKIDSSANAISIVAAAGTINGASSASLADQWDSLTVEGTTAGYVISSSTNASITGGGGGGGGTLPALPTSVSAAENFSLRRLRLTDQVIETAIEVTVNLPTGHGAEWMNVWFYEAHDSAWGALEGTWKVGDPIVIWRAVWDSTWTGSGYYVRVTTGNSDGGDNPPADAVVSGSFSIAAIGAPSDASLSSISISGPAYAGVNAIGAPYWVMALSASIAATPDPNTWTYCVTVEGVNGSGTSDPGPSPNAGEREWFEFVNGADVSAYPLLGNYNDGDSAYTSLRIKVYGVKNDRATAITPGWKDPNSVLVKWPDANTYKIVSFGSRPQTLDPTAFPSDALGFGLMVSLDGVLEYHSTDPSNLAPNPEFDAVNEDGTVPGWTLSGGAVHSLTGGYVTAPCIKCPQDLVAPVCYESVKHVIWPGDKRYVALRYKSDTGANGIGQMQVGFWDSTGTFISASLVTQVVSPTSGAWATTTVTVTAPTNAAHFRIGFNIYIETAADWYFDAAMIRERNTTAGITVDSDGKYVLNLDPASTELEIDSNNRVNIKGVNFSKGFNGFEVGSTAIPKITVAPDGTPVGWIGKDTTSGYAGAWFKRCYIGGTSPVNAGIVADASGNVAISGSLIVGAVASATSAGTAVSAGSLSLTLNSITTIVNNSLNDGYVTALYSIKSSGMYPRLWVTPDQIVMGTASFSTLANISTTAGRGFIQVANGSGGQVYLDGVGNVYASSTVTAASGFTVGATPGITTTITYVKPGGSTGTLTFAGGILISST